MEIFARICQVKLVSGENIISLVLLPKAEYMEESIESGFSDFVNLVFPTIIKESDEDVSLEFLQKYSVECSTIIPEYACLFIAEATDEIKTLYSSFINDNGFDNNTVIEEAHSLLRSRNTSIIEEQSKNIVFH